VSSDANLVVALVVATIQMMAETKQAQATGLSGFAQLAVLVATSLSIVSLVMALLLTPLWVHRALDISEVPQRLLLEPDRAHELSDGLIGDLVTPGADFRMDGGRGGPFLDARERAHLADVRGVLLACLMAGGLASIGLVVSFARSGQRQPLWRAVGRGGALVLLGLVALAVYTAIDFERAFDGFHALFFPGGNYIFDPRSQSLVVLYPPEFWQLTGIAAGVLAGSLGSLAALGGRRLGGRWW